METAFSSSMSAITCCCAPNQRPMTSTIMGSRRRSKTLPKLHKRLATISDNYLNVQQDILETFVDRGQLVSLAETTVLPSGKRIPGLKLDHPRQLALMHALVRFAHVAAGNTFRLRTLLHRRGFGMHSVAIPSFFVALRPFQIES